HDYAPGAPITSTGAINDSFHAIKRISTFATQFSQVLAHLSPEDQPAALQSKEGGSEISVIAQTGTQGDVVFILRGEGNRAKHAELLLPGGSTLSVPMGKDRAAWVLVNANLEGMATLDYTNLRPWAFLDQRMLVLFAPAGSEGVVSIDGALLELKVPGGFSPLITQHESLTIVILNDEQLDAAFVTSTGLLIGASELDEEDQPTLHAKFKHVTLVSSEGKMTKVTPPPVRRSGALPKLGAWACPELDAMLKGEDESFAALKELASLDKLAHGAPCGWYRLALPASKAAPQVMAPKWRGRVRVFAGGQPVALIGDVADAIAGPLKLPAARELVLFADSPGRLCEGWRQGEQQGPVGDLYAVKPVRLGKAATSTAPTPDVSSFCAFLSEFAFGDHVVGSTWKWTVKPKSREGLIVRIKGLPFRAVLLANDEPVAVYDPVQSAGCVTTFLEVGAHITGGRNALVLAAFDTLAARTDAGKFVSMFDITANLTSKAEWAFAPWKEPKDEAFAALKTASRSSQPRWYRSEFRLPDATAPLFFDPQGLSKGHVLLNGRHVGGYWQSIAGKAVANPQRLLLPDAWLKTDAANVLMIFDEEGRSPKASRLGR
ncbi:MAG: hypothetical protein WD768_17410, partial [Phycisphaeraceae bacterium]